MGRRTSVAAERVRPAAYPRGRKTRWRIFRDAVLLSLLACTTARADSWAPPSVQVVASESGEHLVRVEPGRRGQDPPRAVLYRHDAGSESYLRRVAYALPQRVAPVDVLLADDGTLVALDEWAQVGRGIVVVTVHDAAGRMKRSYTLQALLGKAAAAAAPSSVSSTWWRCGKPSLIAGGRVLRVVTYDEGELRIDLRDGKVEHERGSGRCR